MFKLQTDIQSTSSDYPVPDSGFIIENLDNFFSSPLLSPLGVIDDDISARRVAILPEQASVSRVFCSCAKLTWD